MTHNKKGRRDKTADFLVHYFSLPDLLKSPEVLRILKLSCSGNVPDQVTILNTVGWAFVTDTPQGKSVCIYMRISRIVISE